MTNGFGSKNKLQTILHGYSHQPTVMQSDTAGRQRSLWEGGPSKRPLGDWIHTLTRWFLTCSLEFLQEGCYKKSKPGTSDCIQKTPCPIFAHHLCSYSLSASSSTMNSEPLHLVGDQLCVPVAIALCQEGMQPRGGLHHRACAMLWIMMPPGYELNNLLLHKRYFSSNKTDDHKQHTHLTVQPTKAFL